MDHDIKLTDKELYKIKWALNCHGESSLASKLPNPHSAYKRKESHIRKYRVDSRGKFQGSD